MLIQLIIALILIGVVLYLITLIPMDNTIKQVIRVIVIVAVVIWCLLNIGNMSSGNLLLVR